MAALSSKHARGRQEELVLAQFSTHPLFLTTPGYPNRSRGDTVIPKGLVYPFIVDAPALAITAQLEEDRLGVMVIGCYEEIHIKRQNCRFGWSVDCEEIPFNTCRGVDDLEVPQLRLSEFSCCTWR